MPSRADWEAAFPKCPRPSGLVSGRVGVCGRSLIWHDPSEKWVCLMHGSVMTGLEAALRLLDALRGDRDAA